MHIIAAVQTAFSLWMLADAYQRRAGTHWYFIVLLPFGELVYFLMVKIHDPEFRRIKGKLVDKRITLRELEYNARTTPSIHNKVLLGQALFDRGEFGRATELFHDVLDRDDENKPALQGLGLCRLKLGETADAIRSLERLIELDFGYDDYSVCADLALAYSECGRAEDAVSLLDRLAAKSRRISHRVELAEYMCRIERRDEAREALRDALEDYQNSPGYIKRLERPWIRRANRLLRAMR